MKEKDREILQRIEIKVTRLEEELERERRITWNIHQKMNWVLWMTGLAIAVPWIVWDYLRFGWN